MGSILSAECQCGYHQYNLLVGGGKRTYDTLCAAPALCEACADIFILNCVDEPPHRCPQCQGNAVFYDSPALTGELIAEKDVFDWHISAGRTFRLPEANYTCPRCKQKQLRFYIAGMWD